MRFHIANKKHRVLLKVPIMLLHRGFESYEHYFEPKFLNLKLKFYKYVFLTRVLMFYQEFLKIINFLSYIGPQSRFFSRCNFSKGKFILGNVFCAISPLSWRTHCAKFLKTMCEHRQGPFNFKKYKNKPLMDTSSFKIVLQKIISKIF